MFLKDFSKEKFDIIVQAGQSNSDGYAFGDVENAFKPDNRVWYLTGDWQVPDNFHFEPAKEYIHFHYDNLICGNFSLAFARRYIEEGRLEPERKLLILRNGVGGTGFLDNYWKPGDRLYVRMMNMIQTALELNPENRLKALLWHQGETEALFFQASYDVHYKNLMDFVRTVRGTLEMPELPFVAGDFTEQWSEEHKDIVVPVVQAIRSVCKDAGMAAFVESTGLLSNAQDTANNPNTDSIHFCRRAIYELGNRYYDAFAHLVTSC